MNLKHKIVNRDEYEICGILDIDENNNKFVTVEIDDEIKTVTWEELGNRLLGKTVLVHGEIVTNE